MMKRRKFIRNSAGIIAAPLLMGVYSWQVEPFWLEFVHVPMPITDLPKELEGKTIMQISDIHVGERFPRQYLVDSLKMADRYKPDIVVYTGDFVSYDGPEQYKQLDEVMEHTVYGNLGTFGVLGNHDYGKNWSQSEVASKIVAILEQKRINILRNASVDLAGIRITGLDDLWGTNYMPTEILQESAGLNAHITLCHNPDVLDEPIWQDIRGWVLAGHTHGGQVKIPFLNPPILPVKNKRFSAGKISINDNLQLYINRALGHRSQVRFNVRPEITIFTLERK